MNALLYVVALAAIVGSVLLVTEGIVPVKWMNKKTKNVVTVCAATLFATGFSLLIHGNDIPL